MPIDDIIVDVSNILAALRAEKLDLTVIHSPEIRQHLELLDYIPLCSGPKSSTFRPINRLNLNQNDTKMYQNVLDPARFWLFCGVT